MNNPGAPNKDSGVIATYHGTPHTPHAPKEKSKWKEFFKSFGKWWSKKWVLSNDWLDAKVMQERATAVKTLAEASVSMATARKIATETAKIAYEMDASKAQEFKPVIESGSEAECQREIEQLQTQLADKIRSARERYGTRIALIQNPDAPQRQLEERNSAESGLR